MDLNSIMDRRFTEAMRGYKKEEVDECLSDIQREINKLKRDYDELNEKFEVCVDKIREYREDEEALKDALLGAQKQGIQVVNEAKEKAENIVNEAQEKADGMIKEAEDNVAQKKEEAEKIIADALAEKQRIETEAKKAADDLHTDMMIQKEIDEEVLARTKREAEDFRTRLIVEYTNHIEFIKALPEQCENEFVKKTVAEHSTDTLRDLIASQQQSEEVVETILPAPEVKEEETEATAEDEVAELDIASIFGGEAAEEPVDDGYTVTEEEEDSDGGFTVESAFEIDNGGENDSSLDFLSNRPNKNKQSKYNKLEFGSNNNNNNGKKKKR